MTDIRFSTIVNPAPSDGFFWGFQMTNGVRTFYPWSDWTLEQRITHAAQDIRGCNAGWTRAYLLWGDVEPVIERSTFELYLEQKDYPIVSEITDQMIQDYAFNQGAWSGDNANDWGTFDILVKHLTDNGVGIFMNLGLADMWAVPTIAETGKKLQPDRVGREKYLGLLYLHCRAAVRRYGPRVQYWQLEDELNAAYLRGVVFYRVREGNVWRDEDFKNRLLRTMSNSVLHEGESLGLEMYRMIYLHTFLSDKVLTATWLNYAVRWAPYYDLVGLDIYPNSYTVGFIPQLSASISLQINMTVGALESAGYTVGVDKFVYVSETSFPTEPPVRGYNEKNQAIAINAAINGAPFFGSGVLGTRASGFCWGTLTGPEESGNFGDWTKRSRWSLAYTDPFMGIIKPGSPVRYTQAYYNLTEAIGLSGRAPLEMG